MTNLTLSVLARGVRIESDDTAVLALLRQVYGSMDSVPPSVHLEYRVGRADDLRSLVLTRNRSDTSEAEDEGEFLWLFDGDLAVELQKLRSDLYFLHAAALGFRDRACLLVGGRGSGKSTLTWGLVHHGFDYLSDELGPIDLQEASVYPYPRALCLKKDPDRPFSVAETALRTSRCLYLPVVSLPSGIVEAPLPVAATFLLRYDPEATEPCCREISAANAATRIYVNTLNALAHSADGLDGAIRIATASKCFELIAADIEATCRLVKTTFEELVR